MSQQKQPRLTGMIFLRTAAAILAVSVACIVVTLAFFYSTFLDESQNSLQGETASIAAGVEMGGLSYLERLTPREDLRITLVDPNGSVLYDSQADPSTMDNHASRPEVRDALGSGYGEARRVSGTLATWTIYRAQRIADGSVVRLSLLETSPMDLFGRAAVPLILLLLLAMALAVALAAATSKKIVAPINQIDLKSPESASVYTELIPLTHRIAAQNQQIQEQMRQQEELYQAQDQFRRDFTANVSHELKTPLTSISGFAEIIRDGLVQPQDISHFADNIYREAQRLIVLVGDIIKISRIDDQQVPIQKEFVDLYDLSEVILDRLRLQAGKAGVTLSLLGDHAKILGSYQVMDEMIYNLCDNAIKYNRPGGQVHLTIHTGPTGTSLTVRDTGIGIPKEHQDRVFERFYRVDKNRSRQIGGTGLGLSIVKHGALFHNASVALDSTPGVGTAITITFSE